MQRVREKKKELACVLSCKTGKVASQSSWLWQTHTGDDTPVYNTDLAGAMKR